MEEGNSSRSYRARDSPRGAAAGTWVRRDKRTRDSSRGESLQSAITILELCSRPLNCSADSMLIVDDIVTGVCMGQTGTAVGIGVSVGVAEEQ